MFTNPPNRAARHLWIHISVALALILLVCLIYLPGIRGPFVLDDGENITLNRAVAIESLNVDELKGALLGNNSGPLGRPLASLSFAINAYLAGGVNDPFPFKVTNIVIHAVNAILIYLIALQLLRIPLLRRRIATPTATYLALLTATFWAIHPIQLTSVLYVVQRMTSLSSLFVLLGIWGFLRGRARYDDGHRDGLWIASASIVIGTAIGVAVKEIAILLPLLALVIEFTMLSRETLSESRRRQLYALYVVTVLFPALIVASYIALHPEFVTAGYFSRDFTLTERVLTESRVLFFYLLLLFVPLPQSLGLFHDDFVISNGLLSPPSTVAAILSLTMLTAWALFRRKQTPLLAFAILWFFASHALESTIFPLEIAYEHRNYLASFGVVFAALIGSFCLLQAYRPNRLYLPIAVVLIAVIFAFSTWTRSHTWSTIETLAKIEVRNHPLSARAHDFAARVAVQMENDTVRAINHSIAALELKPREPGAHIDLYIFLATLVAQLSEDRQLIDALRESGEQQIVVNDLSNTVSLTHNSGKLHFSTSITHADVVTSLLRERPITVHTVFTMDNLRRCILIPPHTCQSLRRQALEWHEVALVNPRSTAENKAALAFNIALFHAHTGDLLKAISFLEQASIYEPHRLAYRLGQADYLLRLGRLTDAREVLATAESTSSTHELSTNRGALNRLKAAIQAAKAQN